MPSTITTIIFSKNRAGQLELLLRSLNLPATVLYTHDPAFQSGYDQLIKMYPRVKFDRETDFKTQVIEYFEKSPEEYILFLVDDDVMIKPFEENCPEFERFKKNPDILCLSLRLAPHYDGAPAMQNNTWRWRGLKHDWGYPMSVSAHIFRKKDLLPIFRDEAMATPNDFEVILRKNPPDKSLMMCLDEPRIINNAANLVQFKYYRRNLGIPVTDINDKFLKGLRISLEDIMEKAKHSKSCFLMSAYKYENTNQSTDHKKDLTIIFLTANQTPEFFADYQRKILLEAAGDYPIITVSRKPMNFGVMNLLDTEPKCLSNIYRQMLRAAKLATTDYIAIAEDDVLYPDEHYSFYRPEKDTFAYNQSRWALFTWTNMYSWRDRKSNCSLIAPRALMIEALEERFAKYPDGTPEEKTGELGRWRVEKKLKLTLRKSIEVFSSIPLIQFNHDNASEAGQRRHHKRPGPLKAYDIPHWGPAKGLVKFYR